MLVTDDDQLARTFDFRFEPHVREALLEGSEVKTLHFPRPSHFLSAHGGCRYRRSKLDETFPPFLFGTQNKTIAGYMARHLRNHVSAVFFAVVWLVPPTNFPEVSTEKTFSRIARLSLLDRDAGSSGNPTGRLFPPL
ncbi:hypothetical protein K0M31_004743 [Melipona bicolor]|uniref:Uncharacterized protein n=1 Tax=Melipona bicolor TaxID=60889 RepID=A0AA40FVD9_9HYME|nr:hypothetical protein K0M31_004743 [Melipona bicolor]